MVVNGCQWVSGVVRDCQKQANYYNFYSNSLVIDDIARSCLDRMP